MALLLWNSGTSVSDMPFMERKLKKAKQPTVLPKTESAKSKRMSHTAKKDR